MALGDKLFVVATDEINTLHVYERAKPSPIGDGIDLESFTKHDKSDLEGAAVIGDRIYWISSHSFNSRGEDKTKRKIFFATDVKMNGTTPTLVGTGAPNGRLRDPLAAELGLDPGSIDIEGLAATPKGTLLLGFRSPLRDGKALVAEIKNPAGLVEKGEAPEFGSAVPIDLKGMGIRSMELIDPAADQYLIVAGPVSDAPDGFGLYRWSRTDNKATKIDGIDLTGLRPEGLFVVLGGGSVVIVSDDGDLCDDEKTTRSDRRFRSIEVRP